MGGAFALTLKAYVQSIKGCLDDALQNSMEACRIHHAVGTLSTPYGADSLSVLALTQATLSQEAAASLSRAEAQRLRKSCGLEDGCTLINLNIQSAGNIDIEQYCEWKNTNKPVVAHSKDAMSAVPKVIEFFSRQGVSCFKEVMGGLPTALDILSCIWGLPFQACHLLAWRGKPILQSR